MTASWSSCAKGFLHNPFREYDMHLDMCRCQCERSPVECLKDVINIACNANSVDRDIQGRVKFLSGCLEDFVWK